MLRVVCGKLQGKTEVLVQEASNTVSYVLDENLIDFGSALEARDYDRYDAAQCVMLSLHCYSCAIKLCARYCFPSTAQFAVK